MVAELVAVGVGETSDEEDGLGEGDEVGEGDGEAEVLGDGEGLTFIEGFGVGLTVGLTEGFGVGEGEGVGVGSGVGLGEGEVCPKTASLGGAGNKTDLTQNPDPVNIKTSKTPRETVNFEGLF